MPLNVLKLHGSLNWMQTDNGIISLDLHDYVDTKRIQAIAVESNSFTSKLGLGEVANHNRVKNCKGETVIVPPSWSKTEYQALLTNGGNVPHFELSEAHTVHIIGYSLPDTDVFFKLLFGLGTASSEPLQKINVYNPDPTVQERFRLMLGPGTEQRYNFKPMKFDEAITDLFGREGVRQWIL